jgi:hypothetical protein
VTDALVVGIGATVMWRVVDLAAVVAAEFALAAKRPAADGPFAPPFVADPNAP